MRNHSFTFVTAEEPSGWNLPRPVSVLSVLLIVMSLSLAFTSQGHAVGLLQLLFSPPPPAQTYQQVPIAEPDFTPQKIKAKAKPKSKRNPSSAKKHTRPAAALATLSGPAHRALCVRTTDGYFFPPPNGGSTDAQQAGCTRLCPNIETRLFYMPMNSDKLEDAKDARTGETYARISAQFSLPSTLDRNAHSCHPQTEQASTGGTVVSTVFADPTLRRGDLVVLSKGIRMFRGAERFPYSEQDFIRLSSIRDLPKDRLYELAQMERILHLTR